VAKRTRSFCLHACRQTQVRCHMALARSALANQHHWFVPFDVPAFGQFTNLSGQVLKVTKCSS
jgi:hypothetical protein